MLFNLEAFNFAVVGMDAAIVPRRLMLIPVALFLMALGVWLAGFHLRITILLLLLVRPALDLVKAGPLVGAISLLLIGVWALLNIESWRKVQTKWMFGPFAMIAYAAVTVSFAPVRSEAISGVIRLAGSFAMIWFISHAFGSKPKDRRLVLLVAAASCIVPVGLGIWQFLNDAGYQEGDVTRIEASFENANVFGFYLLGILPIVFGFGLLSGKVLKRAMLAFVPVLLVLLYITYTRTALVAVLVASVIATLTKKENRKLKVVALAALFSLSSLIPSVQTRFSDLNDPNPYGRAGNSNSFAWRIEQWTLISTYIPSQPATGVGINGTRSAIRSDFLAHSAWLQLLFELGAFGLLTAVVTANHIRRLHRRAKEFAHNREFEVLLMASKFSCVAFLIIGMADNVLIATALHWYFFLPTALLAGAIGHREAAQRDDPSMERRRHDELESLVILPVHQAVPVLQDERQLHATSA